MKAGKPKTNKDDIELTGTVIQKNFAGGSKSEHNAVYLETADATYQLRRLGGNPFSDPELKKLVGQKVIVAGTLMGSVFLASVVQKDSSCD